MRAGSPFRASVGVKSFRAAIRVVAAGDGLLAPSITRRLIAEFARRPDPVRPPPADLNTLTERELEVLALIARGLSNSEIARRLFVSQATVKSHIGHLLGKLDARDRAQLVIVAYETGWPVRGRSRRPGPSRMTQPIEEAVIGAAIGDRVDR